MVCFPASQPCLAQKRTSHLPVYLWSSICCFLSRLQEPCSFCRLTSSCLSINSVFICAVLNTGHPHGHCHATGCWHTTCPSLPQWKPILLLPLFSLLICCLSPSTALPAPKFLTCLLLLLLQACALAVPSLRLASSKLSSLIQMPSPVRSLL